MQLVEANLSKEEVKSLGRFVGSVEAEYAMTEHKVISLAKTIEAGGYVDTVTRKEPDTIDFESADFARDPRMSPDEAYRRRSYEEAMRRQLSYQRLDYETRYEMLRDGRVVPERKKKKTPYHVPALAIAPHAAHKVHLNSDNQGYHFTRGNWDYTVKPSWHTNFSRGTFGQDLHTSQFESKLPPIPREGREAAADYGFALCLWEADWEEEEQYLDPAILVPVWKDLYAVVFHWDLTELELQALKKASGD